MTVPASHKNHRTVVFKNLRASFDEGRKLRVWSVLITIFGDAIVPRGGKVGLASLLTICECIGIEPNAVRTALSRLVKDSWIIREKVGRQSFYSLASDGKDSFQKASRKIYAGKPPAWDGKFQILFFAESDKAKRDDIYKELIAEGYGPSGTDMFIRPNSKGLDDVPVGAFASMQGADLQTGSLPEFARLYWPVSDLENAYRALLNQFASLSNSLEAGQSLSDLESLAARVLLIHEWRRIVLKYPELPKEFYEPEWLGHQGRTLVKSLYQQLLAASEAYLDTCMSSPDEWLGKPGKEFHEHFK